MPGKSSSDRFFTNNQIVVADGDLPAVRKAVEDLKIGFVDQDDRIPELGLRLISLENVGVINGDIYLRRYAESILQAERPGDFPLAVDDLDLLLFQLRFDFARRYGGWVPTIAKNRPITTGEGVGDLNGGLPRGPARSARLGANGDIIGDGEINGGGGGPIVLDRAVNVIEGQPDAGQDVRIAVLDTQVYEHDVFKGRDVHGVQEGNGPAGGPAMAGHGTFGVGLILGQAPAARIDCHRVLDDDGSAMLWSVVQTMMKLETDKQLDVHILHLPWGCVTRDGKAPFVLAAAIAKLYRPGRVIVAAAGNHGDSADPAVSPSTPGYPAGLSEALAIGATGPRGELTDYTPRPRLNPWIDIAECGDRVRSTYLGNGFAQWSGTSFAAARFTGLLAAGATEFTVTSERRDLAKEAKHLVSEWREAYEKDYR